MRFAGRGERRSPDKGVRQDAPTIETFKSGEKEIHQHPAERPEERRME